MSQLFFIFLEGKLQGLTSKSKVHCRNKNVSRMPYKNHWTPHSCDEEKQGRLQSQHNFLPFPQKKKLTRRFCPFAARRLRSAVKRDLQRYYGLKIFFFPSGNNDLMSSKRPPRDALIQRPVLLSECEGVIRGVLRTKSHC